MFSWERGVPDRLLVNSLTIRVVDEPRLPADFDADGDVDLADFLWSVLCFEDSGRERFDRCIDAHADGFLRLSECFDESEQARIDRCFNADLDWDGDVDLADVISLMGMYTNAN